MRNRKSELEIQNDRKKEKLNNWRKGENLLYYADGTFMLQGLELLNEIRDYMI